VSTQTSDAPVDRRPQLTRAPSIDLDCGPKVTACEPLHDRPGLRFHPSRGPGASIIEARADVAGGPIWTAIRLHGRFSPRAGWCRGVVVAEGYMQPPAVEGRHHPAELVPADAAPVDGGGGPALARRSVWRRAAAGITRPSAGRWRVITTSSASPRLRARVVGSDQDVRRVRPPSGSMNSSGARFGQASFAIAQSGAGCVVLGSGLQAKVASQCSSGMTRSRVAIAGCSSRLRPHLSWGC
jgi:hypothetical protein